MKTNKEFNLSEEICNDGAGYLLNIEDVREFIKRLKEELRFDDNDIAIPMIIDKLAGDELK